MKARIFEANRTHTSTDKYPYFLEVQLFAETPEEGMELGFLASRLRQEDIWCIIDKSSGRLTVSARRQNEQPKNVDDEGRDDEGRDEDKN